MHIIKVKVGLEIALTKEWLFNYNKKNFSFDKNLQTGKWLPPWFDSLKPVVHDSSHAIFYMDLVVNSCQILYTHIHSYVQAVRK